MDCEVIQLEKPLFYNNAFGLRFEIGPSEEGVWTDYDKGKLNEKYFNAASDRAMSILDATFSLDDDVSIAYQIFSDGRKKIKKRNFILKQISDITSKRVIFTDHREIYSEDLDYKSECWRRVTVSGIKTRDVNSRNILMSLINTDFDTRLPSVYGECYFINHTKGMVLNLYDDRGMDVVALEKESLQSLYKSHNNWILDYDREEIDLILS